MQLLLATTNKGKIRELSSLLAGLPLQLLTAGEVGSNDRKQLDAALNNIYEKRTAQGKNITYCINYMGFEIEIPMEYVYGPLAGKPYDKKKTIGLLKKSNFYNMMKTL